MVPLHGRYNKCWPYRNTFWERKCYLIRTRKVKFYLIQVNSYFIGVLYFLILWILKIGRLFLYLKKWMLRVMFQNLHNTTTVRYVQVVECLSPTNLPINHIILFLTFIHCHPSIYHFSILLPFPPTVLFGTFDQRRYRAACQCWCCAWLVAWNVSVFATGVCHNTELDLYVWGEYMCMCVRVSVL